MFIILREKGKESSYFNANTKLEVDLAWAIKAKQAKHDKRKAKQAEHNLDDVDLDHVDFNLDHVDLDLESRVKKLEEDFSRMLKTKKAKEAKEAQKAELKANKVCLWMFKILKRILVGCLYVFACLTMFICHF
ncbi:hypothetical protein Tco_0094979 [Tanacetum coccineum]